MKKKFENSQIKYFDKIAEINDKKGNFAADFEFSQVVSFLNLSNKKNILEVGCGIGRYSLKLLENGHSVYGVDISKKSLNILFNTYKKRKTSKWGKLKLSSKFPVKQKFDACICINILHHLENPDEMLKKIKINLRNNGAILIFEPNPLYPLWYPYFLLKGILNIERGILRSNLWNLKKILKKEGYKKIQIMPYGIFPTRILFKSPALLKTLTITFPSLPIINYFCFHNLIRAEKHD